MRSIRIRTFTVLCFLFILLLPWIFFVTAHFLDTKSVSLSKSRMQNETLQRHLTDTIHFIEASTDEWTNLNWQKELNEKLQIMKLEAVIQSTEDRDIFRSNPERRGSLSSTERFSIIEDGQLIGRVTLYLPKSSSVSMFSAFAGLLLAFFVVGVEIRRYVLKPLESMSFAARRIAGGDLEVQLPSSRITEVAEVRDGFEAMVKGLRQSFDKQAELEEERRFVIGAVAHDLRTPLFALRGYIDGLEQGIAQSPEKVTKYLAVCKEKSAQLDRLVEDLFTFTKMEYLETELNEKPIDLQTILIKSIDSLSPLARQKRISIEQYNTEKCIISGDAHLLERAVSNLLDNAVRHAPVDGEIEIQCINDCDRVVFSIHDSGPGFSSEELKRIFEPLYRGEASRSRSTGGSGLGLAISQRIIRRHKGELTASNHPEGGALLTGWIPVTAPESE